MLISIYSYNFNSLHNTNLMSLNLLDKDMDNHYKIDIKSLLFCDNSPHSNIIIS